VIETGIGGEIGTEIMTNETEMIEEDEIDHPEGVTDQDHHTAETGIEIVHQKVMTQIKTFHPIIQ
jgi:hypothetical protein